MTPGCGKQPGSDSVSSHNPRVPKARDHDREHPPPMPTYRYRCGSCGKDVEIWQSITSDSLTTHDAIEGATCTGPLTKVLSPAGIVLKGSGFYKTDNRSGSSRSGSSSDSRSSESSSGDSKSGDSKSGDSSGGDSKSSDSSSSGKSGSGKSSDSGSGSNGSGSKDGGSKDGGSKSGAGTSTGSSSS